MYITNMYKTLSAFLIMLQRPVVEQTIDHSIMINSSLTWIN